MRIAIVTLLPPTEMGGIERQVQRLTWALESRGHEVVIFAAAKAQVGRAVSHLWGTRLVRQSEAISREVTARGPFDVVVCNGLFGPLEWPAGRVCWFHSCLRAYAEAMGDHMRAKYRWITSRVLGGQEERACRSGTIVTVSGWVAEQLRSLYGARDVRVVSNGVDLSHFTPGPREPELLRSLGVPEGRKVLLFAGRWERGKGTDTLCALAESLGENAVLLAAVGGTAAAVPETRNLIVAGNVSWDDLPRLYRSVNCLVFPSYYESFGLVMAEAAACGLPMVTRAVGWAPELAEAVPEYRPFVLPAGSDAAAFAAAAGRLLGDPALRERLSEAGRGWVAAHYDERERLGEMVRLVEAAARQAVAA